MELSIQELRLHSVGGAEETQGRDRRKQEEGKWCAGLCMARKRVYIIFATHYLGYCWIQPKNIEFRFVN